ncbi:UNVERIFIED_CONTAM: Xyloglucan endotransglucosylase/hydrolase protein 9 [Sesamum calycinum]|uniref:Xyloglucan endotransglucosylase/hydrolase n=1 Tax=Sesamum calycinum TaxID=2727403 RepID=A0AAW2LRE9_9LAMI
MKMLSYWKAILTVINCGIIAVHAADFDDLFQASWAPDHIVVQGAQIALSLDSSTGCGFESKNKYLFGKASAQLKLVEGDSAGTVTAFYMASEGPNRDELDFEFLGNVSGEPFLVDDIPIREFPNKEKKGVAYPRSQAMGSFEIDACQLSPDGADDPVVKCGKSGQFWWDKPVVKEVNKQRKRQLKWIRDNFLIYDYCQDVARFTEGILRECLQR